MKVGIFGGSFNPPHMGHLNCVQTVQKRLSLDEVLIIPTSQNPLKSEIEGPGSQQRFEMAQKAFETWGPNFKVSDIEIKHGGKSYSVDTIQALQQQRPNDEFYFILGADAFANFQNWKDVKKLISISNWVITSRPGFSFPDSADELPEILKEEVADFDFNFIELKSGKSIQFVRLQDLEISATDLRKWLRIGKKVEKLIPLSVESYINSHKLYRPLGDKIGDTRDFTEFCAQTLFSKKAINVRGFDLKKTTAPAEYTLVASGTSTKQASSLAENMVRIVKEEFNVYPQSIEGTKEGRWVVVDYGSVIVHVFYDFVRQEYALENLWKEAVDLQIKEVAQ
jgi:nicotinate-nucleotide adenylyltransferase